MARRKPRTLRKDEAELWAKVVEKAVPLHPEHYDAPPRPPATPPKPHRAPVPRFRLGSTSKPNEPGHDISPNIADQVARQPLSMDRNRFLKLKKGRLSPEARIDLHGMTLAQAHPALVGFVLDAAADGRRLILVITGKGKSRPDHGPIPERHGALRHQVPHWLNSAPLKQHVLQIAEAHAKHGGQGAYYVYLKRARP